MPKKCPYCAEEVQPEAVICKHCNRNIAAVSEDGTVSICRHPEYRTFTILSILIPIAGFILGLVYMSKADPLEKKLGEHMLSLGVLFTIIYSLVWYFWIFTHPPVVLFY